MNPTLVKWFSPYRYDSHFKLSVAKFSTEENLNIYSIIDRHCSAKNEDTELILFLKANKKCTLRTNKLNSRVPFSLTKNSQNP